MVQTYISAGSVKDVVRITKGYPLAALGAASIFFVAALAVFLLPIISTPTISKASQLPAAAATSGPYASTTLEVHIAQNGLVLLRGARIEKIQGTTLVVSTAWGSTEFNWSLETNASQYGPHSFGTRVMTRDGSKLGLSELAVGDRITVTGTLDTAAQGPTIRADTLRRL
jgi:hypothetical protein